MSETGKPEPEIRAYRDRSLKEPGLNKSRTEKKDAETPGVGYSDVSDTPTTKKTTETTKTAKTAKTTGVVSGPEQKLAEKPPTERLDPTRYGDWEKNGRCIDF